MLTPSQLTTLRNDINADPVLSSYPNNDDGAFAIAAAYNTLSTPDYYVWQTAASVTDIFDAIVWANFTPSDAPDGTQIWLNRAMQCQGKQFNLQTMLSGRNTINAARASIRAGLQDATTAIPSGNNGANRSGGWANIQLILSRKATRVEKLFATGAGTQANPSLLTFEGAVTVQDVLQARAN